MKDENNTGITTGKSGDFSAVIAILQEQAGKVNLLADALIGAANAAKMSNNALLIAASYLMERPVGIEDARDKEETGREGQCE